MIPAYEVERTGSRRTTIALCDRHVEARRVLGWTAEPVTRFVQTFGCADCHAGPSVLDREIAADDAQRAAEEPEPVRVLPGQRSLF